MNKNWDEIDRQAENTGIAAKRLSGYTIRTTHNHKAILYNTVKRSDVPEKIITTHKTRRNKPNRVNWLYIKKSPKFSL